jgi:hypothetical protein
VDDPRSKPRGGLLLAALLGAACAAAPPEQREAERLADGLRASVAAAAPEAGLQVLLAFGPEADLDLYVTDPRQETVYFANSPSGTGGRLEADRYCGAGEGGDRIEVVRFREPPTGPYRVGVDYPRSCGAERPAGYAVAVVRGGRILELRTGTVRVREFQLAALDFDVPDVAAPAAPRR